MTMFDVDVKGLAELEGGKPPHRLAFEPVANVFDEYRGYGEGNKRKPTYCAVTLKYSSNPRGVWLTVTDDGGGFENESDIWTFFGSTAKRDTAGVSGRFNAGDKQLLALAREATVATGATTVRFADGSRDITRHRSRVTDGTVIRALMPWTQVDLGTVRSALEKVIPPAFLLYSIDGAATSRPPTQCFENATLPTVAMIDGVLKPTTRKARVDVLESAEPMLYELGIPVCSLADVGFPWSLDVQQKIPVPMSRDMVETAYLYRLIGSVLEQAALDGHQLLTEEQQGAGFCREALDWVREPEALEATVKALYGEHAVRQSSDPIANAQAAASGATIISGRWFSPNTRKRLDAGGVMPTSKERFGGAETLKQPDGEPCPECGGTGRLTNR